MIRRQEILKRNCRICRKCALQVIEAAQINHNWVAHLFVKEQNKSNMVWRILVFQQKLFLPLEITYMVFFLQELIQGIHN